MSINKKTWPIATVCGTKNRINTDPDYQRPAVWSTAQKQLLIDTILRGYDIPKLYWRQTGSRPDKYDVVDGQQRLRAIWDFFDGPFKLPDNADAIEGQPIAGCSYNDLPDDLRIRFDIYPLDIVVLSELDEDEVREMFLRLQNGTSLKAQEKRNAYPGRMRDFVKTLAGHRFFSCVAFANSRYTHDLVAAQMVCMELAGGPTNVKNADLNKMYKAHEDFDFNSPEAKSVRKKLDFLAEIFPDKTPELERFNVIALYCVVSELTSLYAVAQVESELRNWFIEFEKQRREEEQRPEDEANAEWIAYKDRISHSTDAADSIRHRMQFMLRDLLLAFPSLPLRDSQRGFTHEQRMAIFRRDQGECQLRIKCSGARLTWDSWHCDHIEPWERGGKTTVENGQVSCPDCNLSKGARA